MRLTINQVIAIKSSVIEILGEDSKVVLFGSRLDDHAKGGDIDIYVKTKKDILQPALNIARMQTLMMQKIGERKIDILLDAPNLAKQEIFTLAETTGEEL